MADKLICCNQYNLRRGHLQVHLSESPVGRLSYSCSSLRAICKAALRAFRCFAAAFAHKVALRDDRFTLYFDRGSAILRGKAGGGQR